ncbi:Ti-type conjugative transfer relaxase TraA [Ochrobactrum quorumnocens]|uniref:Ti-type conjugative transfer relaxase TraA n=1 Tax=Ochrobactrum quorumnocens TaxID=271865 RepID=A0A5N1K6B8_9HYPH|nr:Ti-type conjugative transfer relaxase TraA [[Ochrobactrum] quorumnocens]KAA9371169.1 Ti-type conjugative transfer relaxase TraA [[Ochrobactrum] quorumnocens]
MAIYHFSMKPVSRGNGRSAVAAIAYRAAEKLLNERDGVTHDFSRKKGVLHSQIILPEHVQAPWAYDREKLWNTAEFSEKRKDARVAREFEIALPHELTVAQRLSAARAIAQELANRYESAVDFAIHEPHREGDMRNHHVHLLMTVREITPAGLGEKTLIERENKWLLSRNRPTTDMQIADLRRCWESIANAHLAIAGFDRSIDHRAHFARGYRIEPTVHMGVHATQIERRGSNLERGRLSPESAARNVTSIRENPAQILSIITDEKCVFDHHDIARTLHRYLNGDATEFQNAFTRVMSSPDLVELEEKCGDPDKSRSASARYTTREMVDLESHLLVSVKHMRRPHGYDAERHRSKHQKECHETLPLSLEQMAAVEHITGPEQIAVVVGYAGAGKSTMLAEARRAWELKGYKVHGAALSGKAAEGLQAATGIQSRTLASWEYGWQNERCNLNRSDVFVLDEAGMIGTKQMSRVLCEAEARGVKIVLVGDFEQLQAIRAGAPFRAIAQEAGYAELTEIRRQRADWQREASVAFATHHTGAGLSAYRDRGAVHFFADQEAACKRIVEDYLADRAERPLGTRVVMAHRRVDVRTMNEAIRSALRARGELSYVENSSEIKVGKEVLPEPAHRSEAVVETSVGKRAFAVGDRLVFLKNDRSLCVRNGMLGTVSSIQTNRAGNISAMGVSLDDRDGDMVRFSTTNYCSFDHGYATTIHKNQGATVDRSFVLASDTMDRHLTYVAMTRHRYGAELYAALDAFVQPDKLRQSGRLIENGKAPFKHCASEELSYFVTLEEERIGRNTVWGIDLERAMKLASPHIGDRLALKCQGCNPLVLSNGALTHRNRWKVVTDEELAFDHLTRLLSRSGIKKNVIDYNHAISGLRLPIQRSVIGGSVDALERVGKGNLGQENSVAWQSREKGVTEAKAVRGSAELRKAPFGMFDGLKLKVQAEAAGVHFNGHERSSLHRMGIAPEGRYFSSRQSWQSLAERARRQLPMEIAVDRYSRAYRSIERHIKEGLPVLSGQEQELREAGTKLDDLRTGQQALLKSVLKYDPEAARSMNKLSGRERVALLISSMRRENLARINPAIGAQRFIERWQTLQNQHAQLSGWKSQDDRQKLERQMHALVESLSETPLVEAELRSQSKALGFLYVLGEYESISHELHQGIGHVQSHDHDLGQEL